MSRWTRDYLTGEVICEVCASPRDNKTRCCRTAPHISFKSFKARYYKNEPVNDIVARDFWEDYLTSNCRSLAHYTEETRVTDSWE